MDEQRPPQTRVTVYGRTDVGRVRAQNEDAFVVVDLNDTKPRMGPERVQWPVRGPGILLAVSDGLGGHNAGEVASALTLESLIEALDHLEGDDGQGVIRAVEQASDRVHEAGTDPSHSGMAATLTLVLLRPDAVYVAEVGDSRAYLLRQDRICQVTHDQSFVQMLVDQGLLTPAQAERSPQRNVVLQVMGQPRKLRVALGRMTLQPGDRLVLCSDGLSNELTDAEIKKIGSHPDGVERASHELVQAALSRGGHDNITVIVAEIDGVLPVSAEVDLTEKPQEPICETAVETVQSFRYQPG